MKNSDPIVRTLNEIFGCTRVEHLSIVLSLDKTQADAYRTDISIVLGDSPPVCCEGDTLKLNYYFDCAYYGSIERKLAAINRLLDVPGLAVSANIEELRKGHSILVSIVQQIASLTAKLTSPLPCDAARVERTKKISDWFRTYVYEPWKKLTQ